MTLFFAQAFYRRYPVAIACRRLKHQIFRGVIHFLRERGEYVVLVSVEKRYRLKKSRAVFLRRHALLAWRDAPHAAIETMLHFALVLRKMLLAIGKPECFAQCRNDGINRICTRIRTVIFIFACLALARHYESGIFLAERGDEIWIRFVILEQDIVSRAIELYQAVFQSERFHLRLADDIIKIVYIVRHGVGLAVEIIVMEILRYPVFERTALADIYDLPRGIFHYIYAGAERQIACLFPQSFCVFLAYRD